LLPSCARAANGTVLETTIPVRKSRRRIAGSLPRDHADDGFQRFHYSRDLLQAKWGLTANLRRKNPKSPMSALGLGRVKTHWVVGVPEYVIF
jgi:hypothetical protein